MATTSTSTVLKMSPLYAANQAFPAAQGEVSTDTETQPASSTAFRSVQTPGANTTRQNLLRKRNIQVQTKVFRTDQDAGAVNFPAVYTTVTEDLL